MPKWLKVVLVVVAVAVFLCGATSGGAYLWFNANKEKIKGFGDRSKQEGLAFAAGTDSEGCLDEGLKRLDAANGIVDQAGHKIFLEACLQAARRSAGFCNEVPEHGEILQTAAWSLDRCTAKNHGGDQDCARLMQAVQRLCKPAR